MALLVPAALGLFWVLCKATPGQDMVPALSLSGLSGAAASLSVIVSNAGSRPDEKVGGPLTPVTDDGGGAAVALVSQTAIVAVAFMLLTVAAKDVPPAEVSLYMLTELVLGEAGVDVSAGRDASTQCLVCNARTRAPFEAKRVLWFRLVLSDIKLLFESLFRIYT